MRTKRDILVHLLNIDSDIHDILNHSYAPKSEFRKLKEETTKYIEEVNEAFQMNIQFSEVVSKDLMHYIIEF